MSELEKRCVKEWHRQNAIFKEAERAGIESVMKACLASMNTLVRVIGYTPKDEQ